MKTKKTPRLVIGLSIFVYILRAHCAGADTNCAATPRGLVSWWQGENNTTDFMGTNNGRFVNGNAFCPAEVGAGFWFDGSGNHIEVAASSSLDVGQGAGMTVEAWINPFDAQNSPIVEWVHPGVFQVHFYIVGGLSGSLYAAIFGSNSQSHVIQSPAGILRSNVFQHVAFTYDKISGIARLFLDGVVVQEQVLGTFTPLTTGDLYIGFRPSTTPFGPNVFHGVIDEVSLYSRGLSSSEIMDIYLAGSAGKCPIIPPSIRVQPQGQAAYWGGGASFLVSAEGTEPLEYLWYKDGFPILWATNSTLTWTNLGLSDAGTYYVEVTNEAGFVRSKDAVLVVNPAGVSLGLYPGVSIEGIVGKTFGIQSTTNVNDSTGWTSVGSVTLSQPVQIWFDTNANVASGQHPRKFYRIIAIP